METPTENGQKNIVKTKVQFGQYDFPGFTFE